LPPQYVGLFGSSSTAKYCTGATLSSVFSPRASTPLNTPFELMERVPEM
jgi:hypothetical protein